MAEFLQLQQEIKGKIITASDKAVYENEIKKPWNAVHRSRRPLAFVKVIEKEDVEKTVKFCVSNKLEICVSAGTTSGYCIKDGAVVIDLSGMRTIQVDEKNKTAVVEGGAKVADVDEALHGYGLVIPLGSFSQLSVAGMTLLGGAGFLSRKYGISSDNILEYDLVLANGESIKVSAKEHPELFWGMKGHGCSFGIVTSMTFQVYEVPQQFVGGPMFFKGTRAKDVTKIVRDYAAKSANDSCLSIYMRIHVYSTGPELVVGLYYSGSRQRGNEIVQELTSLTQPYLVNCGPVDHRDFQKQADFMFPSGNFAFRDSGHVISELNDEIIDNIFSCLKDAGPNEFLVGSTVSICDDFSGKVAEVGYEESSFPFRRNARYWMGVSAVSKNDQNSKAIKQWVDNFHKLNAQFGIQPFDGGNPEEIIQKLRKLKQQYDPTNIFHNNLVPIDST